MNSIIKQLSAISFSMFLVACGSGGGGSGDENNKNTTPNLTGGGNDTVPVPDSNGNPGENSGSDPDPDPGFPPSGVVSGGEGSVIEDDVTSTSGRLTDSTNEQQIFEELNQWGKYGLLEVSSDGLWKYILNSDLANPLSVGEQVVDEFTIGVGSDEDYTMVAIKITGTDDEYTFNPGVPLASLIVGTVEEVRGTLVIDDVDGNTPEFVASNIVSEYGSFRISSNGDWEFSLIDKAKQLKEGDLVEDVITLRFTDGVEHSVTFSISTVDPGANGSFELSVEQKRIMLDTHNEFRQRCAMGEAGEGAGPETAANMQTLSWDNALAKMAKKRASACYFGHLNDAEGIRQAFNEVKDEVSFVLPAGAVEIGENVAINIFNPPASQYDAETWAASVESWYDESYSFDWDAKFCHADTCGHWAQVCHGETRYVGCAVAECDNIIGSSNPAYNDGAHVVVCTYFPSLDKGRESPFVDGFGYDNCRVCKGYDMPFCVDNMCTGGKAKDWNASLKRNKNVDQCTDGLGRDITPCTLGNHPPPPQVVRFDYVFSDQKINLSWGEALKNGGVHHYKLFRDEELLSKTRRLAYSDSDVRLGNSYRYKIIAVDHSGQHSLPVYLDTVAADN
ncbi:VCBS domain-containing protein [Microbulbifer sp. SSSA007]|uniref:VCBS domain-containing protein n=1 Tax=Microbulbifer sp. SSSA007 TaxID=3243379 RepID=UPI0040399A64